MRLLQVLQRLLMLGVVLRLPLKVEVLGVLLRLPLLRGLGLGLRSLPRSRLLRLRPSLLPMLPLLLLHPKIPLLFRPLLLLQLPRMLPVAGVRLRVELVTWGWLGKLSSTFGCLSTCFRVL